MEFVMLLKNLSARTLISASPKAIYATKTPATRTISEEGIMHDKINALF